jgi:NitT/TauT family transport system permease protein
MSGVAPVAVQPVPRGGMARLVGRRIWDWVPAVVFLVLVIGLWQGLVVAFHVQRFLLRKPSEIATTFWDNKHDLWSAGWFTFQEALGGFALGSSLAIVVALVLARWRFLGNALMPYAIAANAIPIIAFAPIMNNWFGLLNPFSKMAIAAVLCFFPVMINTLRGLTSVHPSSIELMRSYAAGRVSLFRRVRIPNALPYMFTGLKVATVLSMIGAIVGEYFGGPTEALGVKILNDSSYGNFTDAWAGIVMASLLGIAFYAVVALAERLTTSWHPSSRAFHTE